MQAQDRIPSMFPEMTLQPWMPLGTAVELALTEHA